MPTTQQMRNLYPELVIGGVDPLWNVLTGGPTCDWSRTVVVTFYAGGPFYPLGKVNLRFHPTIAPWAEALAAVFYQHRYPFEETAGGSVSCRKITGGTKTSPHTHGVAMDINPSRNRYRTTLLGGLIQWGKETDMPMAMIVDAEAIRTVNGKPTTSWGGRWSNIKDPMHFEASKCVRSDLATGINYSTVAGWAAYRAWLTGTPEPPEDDMRVREFVEGLAADPTRIDRLVAAGIIGGQASYWKGKLGNPDDPAWKNFVNAMEVETALRAGGGAHGVLALDLAGTLALDAGTLKATGTAKPA